MRTLLSFGLWASSSFDEGGGHFIETPAPALLNPFFIAIPTRHALDKIGDRECRVSSTLKHLLTAHFSSVFAMLDIWPVATVPSGRPGIAVKSKVQLQ